MPVSSPMWTRCSTSGAMAVEHLVRDNQLLNRIFQEGRSHATASCSVCYRARSDSHAVLAGVTLVFGGLHNVLLADRVTETMDRQAWLDARSS
jgi:hypothetical protein